MHQTGKRETSTSSPLLARIFPGDSEMAQLMRATDWAATPLGSVESWPQSLRTAVSICLASRFPILIWWDSDLVMLYNDAYRPMLGTKHPASLSAPGHAVWPEIWHIIGPMLESVLQEGKATWSDDQFLPLERSGYAEEEDRSKKAPRPPQCKGGGQPRRPGSTETVVRGCATVHLHKNALGRRSATCVAA